MQVEARQIDMGRVHVGRGTMPAPVLTAGPVAARVMPFLPRALPAMTAPLRPAPVLPVPAMSTPVRAVPLPSMRPVRPRMMFSPVIPVPLVPVHVMRGVDPRAGGRHHGRRDE